MTKGNVRMPPELLAYHRAEHWHARVPRTELPALTFSNGVVIAIAQAVCSMEPCWWSVPERGLRHKPRSSIQQSAMRGAGVYLRSEQTYWQYGHRVSQKWNPPF